MTETFFSLTAHYGVWVVAFSAYLSCLAVPIPTAAVMLAAGAFAASGDLDYGTLLATGWLAAVAGDQTGFWIGRRAGTLALVHLSKRPGRAQMVSKASSLVERHGGLGVFFSTWLFAPLGPWVNLTSGAMGLGWARFTFWDVTGEAIWVTGYLSLGYAFADRLEALAALLADLSGLLVGGAITLALGTALALRLRRRTEAA